MLTQLDGKFWSRVAYQIDKYVFSLDDIEHGILRSIFSFFLLNKYLINFQIINCTKNKGNRPHPSTNKRSLEENDPRLQFLVKKFDCRIHFALNCGAKVFLLQ